MSEKEKVKEGAGTRLHDKVMRILSKAYGGEHHIPGKVRAGSRFIEVNVYDGVSTYDNTVLTRLVLGAHDECCRMEIRASSANRLRLYFFNRKRPEDCGWLAEKRERMQMPGMKADEAS